MICIICVCSGLFLNFLREQEVTHRNIIAVYTGHGIRDFRVFGGTAKWTLNPPRIAREDIRYVICVKRASPMQGAFGNPEAEAGSAFLIGRISGVERVFPGEPRFYMGDEFELEGRFLIKFDSFVEISLADYWGTSPNPVAYRSEAELRELLRVDDLSELDFQPLGNAPDEDVDAYTRRFLNSQSGASGDLSSDVNMRLTIPQAKQGLARHLGVAEDDIEITIRA